MLIGNWLNRNCHRSDPVRATSCILADLVGEDVIA